MHLWSRLIDDCFYGHQYFYLERREGTMAATTARRNRHRVPDENARLRTGRRADGVLRLISDPRQEFLLIETSRGFKGEHVAKWRSDCKKVAKGLHDMMVFLNRESGYSMKILRRLQVVGLVCSGNNMQVFRLVCPGGQVCVLKTEQILTLPSNIEKLAGLLNIVLVILQLKEVIEGTAQAMLCGDVARERLRGSDPGETVILQWNDTDPE